MPPKTQDKKVDESKITKSKSATNSKNAVSKKTKKSTSENIDKKTTIKQSKSKTTSKNTNKKSTSKNINKSSKIDTNTTKNKKSKSINSSKKGSAKTNLKRSQVSPRTKKKRTPKVEILEYYDLPYRYNQTVIKILAQTPTTLFVYWDISDSDRENLINQYGEKFFDETKPVLIIHNESNNYSFEIEINDFANSWYLKIPDSKSVYSIELGRRQINIYSKNIKPIKQNYLYITSSNKLEVPNNQILLNTLKDVVYFKNAKTNHKEEFKISTFTKNINKIYNIYNVNNIYDIYKTIYTSEDIKNFDLNNPSSGNPSSKFK